MESDLTYDEQRAALLADLDGKRFRGDWHGVSDAANDLRVLEAEHNIREERELDRYNDDAVDALRYSLSAVNHSVSGYRAPENVWQCSGFPVNRAYADEFACRGPGRIDVNYPWQYARQWPDHADIAPVERLNRGAAECDQRIREDLERITGAVNNRVLGS